VVVTFAGCSFIWLLFRHRYDKHTVSSTPGSEKKPNASIRLDCAQLPFLLLPQIRHPLLRRRYHADRETLLHLFHTQAKKGKSTCLVAATDRSRVDLAGAVRDDLLDDTLLLEVGKGSSG